MEQLVGTADQTTWPWHRVLFFTQYTTINSCTITAMRQCDTIIYTWRQSELQFIFHTLADGVRSGFLTSDGATSINIHWGGPKLVSILNFVCRLDSIEISARVEQFLVGGSKYGSGDVKSSNRGFYSAPKSPPGAKAF